MGVARPHPRMTREVRRRDQRVERELATVPAPSLKLPALWREVVQRFRVAAFLAPSYYPPRSSQSVPNPRDVVHECENVQGEWGSTGESWNHGSPESSRRGGGNSGGRAGEGPTTGVTDWVKPGGKAQRSRRESQKGDERTEKETYGNAGRDRGCEKRDQGKIWDRDETRERREGQGRADTIGKGG